MAKITSVIDIGSNSMRMVVFVKTSRFAFHLINETKSKVKISQDAYLNDGYLQEEPMQRALLALESFLNISKNLKSRKILCVATSALRDAPNKKDFINRVKNQLKFNIKIIDGHKEAQLGGIAALNLLNMQKDFYTIDIGGGSTELSLVKNNTIEQSLSLKIGTVRIQELYFNSNNKASAKEYIINQLKDVPSDFLNIKTVVGLGGTIRALSRAIIHNNNYPFKELHGFTYDVNQNIKLFQKIIDINDTTQLKEFEIKKDRYDTIVVGTFIFMTILEYFQINKVVTSSAGVREGLYLSDILRTSNYKFPTNFNISVRSLLDRFTNDSSQTAYLGNNVAKIFDTLQPLHQLDKKYKSDLIIASKLQQIGISLHYYENNSHSANYILKGLSYCFSHEKRILISKIIKYSKKDLPKANNIEKYKDLLPSLLTLQWLCFMHSLNKILNSEFSKIKYNYSLNNNILNIDSKENLYIVNDKLNKLKKPSEFIMELK
jgi:exopolyphosphatase/guanosine-5'-triphosphate,3'-diphosphate pyrophosphatase